MAIVLWTCGLGALIVITLMFCVASVAHVILKLDHAGFKLGHEGSRSWGQVSRLLDSGLVNISWLQVRVYPQKLHQKT